MNLFATIAMASAVVFAWLWWKQIRANDTERFRRGAQVASINAEIDRVYQRSELLHRMVDGIGDGLMILSSERRVLFANKAMKHFFPPVSLPTGRPVSECLPDARIVAMIEETAKSGVLHHDEFVLTIANKTGYAAEERVYSVEAVPLTDDSRPNVKDALLIILRDETAKHTLERVRRDFVANASHELRTPMAIINGYLENLMDGDIEDDTEQHRVFTIMKKHGDRLAAIVQNLLLISRMESGDSDAINAENFDLESCARDVIHRLTPLIVEKDAKVSITAPPNGGRVIWGDRFYWDQILFNLVQNALKENDAKGLRISIGLQQTASHSEIKVADNGVGIPAADLQFVFKRFYRVAKDRAQKIKGTGLGLSIVKRAVEAHYGSISVSSEPGEATEFVIRVPRGEMAVAQ